MLADEIYKLMGVDPKVPLAERINKIGKGVAGVAKEIPGEAVKQVGAIAKEVAKAPVRAAMIPADVISQVATGKSPEPLQLPLLGEVKSYGRQQEDDIKGGEDPWVAGLRNASIGIGEVAGIAAPLLRSLPATPKATQIYRGENATNKGGNYFSMDESIARRYGDTIVKKDLPKKTFDTFTQSIDETLQKEMTKNLDDMIARGEKVTDEAFYKPLFDKGYDAIKLQDHMTGEVNVLLKPGASAAGLFSFMGKKEEKPTDLVSTTPPDKIPKNYPVQRGEDFFRLREKDLDELAAILYGEISNRSPEKRQLESRIITGIALNRMKEKGKNLTEILQENNQFQAYKGDQYNLYKSGKGDPEKTKLVKEIIDEIKRGDLSAEDYKAFNAYYYKHLKDGRIEVDDKRPLFAKN